MVVDLNAARVLRGKCGLINVRLPDMGRNGTRPSAKSELVSVIELYVLRSMITRFYTGALLIFLLPLLHIYTPSLF